jgi:hypothetical protein
LSIAVTRTRAVEELVADGRVQDWLPEFAIPEAIVVQLVPPLRENSRVIGLAARFVSLALQVIVCDVPPTKAPPFSEVKLTVGRVVSRTIETELELALIFPDASMFQA